MISTSSSEPSGGRTLAIAGGDLRHRGPPVCWLTDAHPLLFLYSRAAHVAAAPGRVLLAWSRLRFHSQVYSELGALPARRLVLDTRARDYGVLWPEGAVRVVSSCRLA